MKAIFQKLKEERIVFADIGARWGIAEPWNHFRNIVSAVGFEPDKEECDLLNQKAKEDSQPIQFLPIALYDKKENLTLNLTKSPGCSSLLRPNATFLNNFPNPDRFHVTREISLKADTFDSVFKDNNINDVDFLKIDTQGTELNILKGAQKALTENVFGLLLEVEFSHLYKDQPLFSDVDQYLRSKGFSLFDLNRQRWKRKNVPTTMPGRGQMIFGDALYFKTDFENGFKKITKAKGLKIIIIAAIHGYYDYGRSLNENFAAQGVFSQKEKEQIKSFLSLKPLGAVRRALGLAKKALKQIVRPSGTDCNWSGSDGFVIDMYVRDIKQKLSELVNGSG